MRGGTEADVELPDGAWRTRFRRALVRWFAAHARALPWRADRDPYAIWLSEVMLQQTTVAMVRPRFERFLAALPTIAALAAADEARVLQLWEGLGYYRRARQLHAAARTIVVDHGGEFPRDLQTVRRLPGVGRYTAGAVLSFAFDLPLPIVEANTQRLYCRLIAFGGNPHAGRGHELLWTFAGQLVPRRAAGRFNQALMDLGSQICGPKPQCPACPMATLCAARQRGLQGSIPLPKPRPIFESRREAAVVVRRGSKLLMVQRPEGGRWAGLWDFLRFELAAEAPRAVAAELEEKVAAAAGVAVRLGKPLATIRHGVTRFRITLLCFEAAATGGRLKHGITARWVSTGELDGLPLSSSSRRLAGLLAAGHAARRAQ